MSAILWSIFVLDLRDSIPAGVSHKPDADDLKIYNEIVDESSAALLQTAVDGVLFWAEKRHTEISPQKAGQLAAAHSPQH